MTLTEKVVYGKIHSVETLGAADGPGLRFVLFLQGCNLRCKYCHNPDSWAKTDGSGVVTASGIAAEILKYKNYFGKKGGLTVSGGEPLLQLDFLIELCGLMKKAGVHVAIDTSGADYSEIDERFEELFPLIDLVLLDIKHIDSEKCKALTGRGNEQTKKFAARLAELKIPVWIRQVLVPGITDDENDLKKTREWIDSLGNAVKTEVLPYHTLGKIKYEKLGIPYPMGDVPVPTTEQIEKAKKILVGDR